MLRAALLHESVRTGTSKNLSADGQSVLHVMTTRLQIGVKDGLVEIRFQSYRGSATMRADARPAPRKRLGSPSAERLA